MLDLASLSLYPATKEQLVETRKRSFAEWARGLSLEQYLQRDAFMDGLVHAKNGHLTTWILAPRNNPSTLDFECACETYLRKGIIATPGSPDASSVSCYGIASVFTPAHKRKRGSARHMMRLLHWVMAPRADLPKFPSAWGSPPPPSSEGNAKFSALYSDIGVDFYHQSGPRDIKSEGWLSVGAISTVWETSSPSLSHTLENDQHQWELLDHEAVEMLWNSDIPAMENDLIKMSKSCGQTCFAFLPSGGVGAFQVHRAATMIPDGSPVPRMDHWGVVLANSNEEPKTFATWTIDDFNQAKIPTLLITRMRATSATLPSLMRRINRVIWEDAKKPGATRIEAWNLPVELELVASELGGKTEERSEHLPSFKWYGDGKEESVKWLFNEKCVYHSVIT
ncbi:hypothetical protein FIBSPDRAFT_757115 [Athelia psychrophila]|uniref:LYC1 C-terminal domain-containing protein n=1 Tax=Athelia psychrophila TaxID=1759441 RepID=A0A166A1I1_9AGAM|nr:hypothetical protein FIBSPDRAFT_757115 [Fibularhizoctonia sp. CBS 109695]